MAVNISMAKSQLGGTDMPKRGMIFAATQKEI
jgi:hypothetical protein